MTLRKLLLPALAMLLLSSAGLRRAAQGQTSPTGLSGSWIGVATVPPEINNGNSSLPIMLSFNSNGILTMVSAPNGNGSDSVAVGTWVSTANGQFSLTANQFAYDHTGNYARNDKFRISVTVSGSQMSGNVEVVVSDTTGAVQGVVSGITFTATPIAVETIGSM